MTEARLIDAGVTALSPSKFFKTILIFLIEFQERVRIAQDRIGQLLTQDTNYFKRSKASIIREHY